MKTNILFLSALCPLLLVSSCASELKRRCKATNWFEYGQSVALSGRRLNADDFVTQCKKEDVEVDEAQIDVGFKTGMGRYCTADGATETGRKGDVFNDELCDPHTVPALRKDYNKGVALYCKPDSGYEQGALGKTYKNVCPEKVEEAFLKQFKRGKRVYISNIIAAKETEASDAERESREAGSRESRLRAQLTALSAAQTQVRASQNLSPEARTDLDRQLSTLESRISSESRQRSTKERLVQTLRGEIRELRVQLGSTMDTEATSAP